jgi:hypothetical protein
MAGMPGSADKCSRRLVPADGRRQLDAGLPSLTTESLRPKEQLAETHPAHAACVYAQNRMSVMAEQLLELPEMKSFAFTCCAGPFTAVELDL